MSGDAGESPAKMLSLQLIFPKRTDDFTKKQLFTSLCSPASCLLPRFDRIANL